MIWGSLPYLSEKVLDIVQPDCGYTGSISQMTKIATLAEAYYVPLAPHCTQSYLGMAANFHVTASVPLFLIHESYDQEPFRRFSHSHWKKGDDGYVSLPERVRLCVEVDEATLLEVAADPNYHRQARRLRMRSSHSKNLTTSNRVSCREIS